MGFFDLVESNECMQEVEGNSDGLPDEPWPALACGELRCEPAPTVLYDDQMEETPDIYAPLEDYECALEVLARGTGRIEFSRVRSPREGFRRTDRRVVVVRVVDGERRMLVTSDVHELIDESTQDSWQRWVGALPPAPSDVDACLDAANQQDASNCLFAFTQDLTCAATSSASECDECFPM